MLEGKIFITGGTGSLGTQFLKRSHSGELDGQVTVYSRDEVKQSQLKKEYPDAKYILGDIRDLEWLKIAMKGHDAVIHAAAYKQVPAAEVNSAQAASVNIDGSRNVMFAADAANIPLVIGISTDKSCAPVNCYGATKMVMEKLFQEANLWSKHTTFKLVRYGNVLGSRGSVVPLFKEQAKKGFVTLTHPKMTRFWMTLNDAADLIVEAASVTYEKGTILIPKCCASSMYTLIDAIAPDVEVKIIGLRPGEKIHESLVHSAESMHTIDIISHFVVYPAYEHITSNLKEGFQYSSNTAPQLDEEQLREMIAK